MGNIMDRPSFLQMAARLGIGYSLPGAAVASEMQSAPPAEPSLPNEVKDGYEPPNPVFKVVGVGGAGCNVVDAMIREGVTGVEFVCADTDAQTLINSSAGIKIQMASNLGAESESTETPFAVRDRILDALRGANLIFIIAGMGGKTGTSAAHVVAEVAKSLGVLTVAFVTKPFESNNKCVQIAEHGIKKLVRHVDSLFVISKENLKEIIGDQVSTPEAFRYADTILTIAVSSIVNIIIVQGLVCLDFADVRAVLDQRETGTGMMGVIGFATATGVDRARIAAEKALECPLLDGANLAEAYGVLAIVTADTSLRLNEYYKVIETVKKLACSDNVTVIVATCLDQRMENRLGVTLFVTGFNRIQNRV
jgi:cell division protein FtsZ